MEFFNGKSKILTDLQKMPKFGIVLLILALLTLGVINNIQYKVKPNDDITFGDFTNCMSIFYDA